VIKSIKEVMLSFTDWKTTRTDERYTERVMRGYFKLLRMRPQGGRYEV
jgi:hypothetical protein